MSVKKIMTFKTGKFVFSHSYSESHITPLLTEFHILYKTIKDLPILPSLSTTLEEELIRRSIFSTAAIEGNPLKEEIVRGILSSLDKKELKESSEVEIRNLKEAYDIIKRLNPAGRNLSLNENLVKKIHKLITKDIHHEYNNPGNYRAHIVKVGDKQHGGVYTPPKCLKDIQNLMTEYTNWINSKDLTALQPPIRAALSHYYLGLIHPFGDGNGRTARIIEASILRLSGIKYIPTMLSNYYYRNIDNYFLVFSQSRKSKDYDVTPFIEFVLRGCIESLYEIKQRITFYIRKFILRDYYEFLKAKRDITKRQYELLISLLEMHENYSFSLKELSELSPFRLIYSSVSDRTARRDLVKLGSIELLIYDNNRYFLNWRVLDAI